MAKRPQKEVLIKIIYCKDRIQFPGCEKFVAVEGRGRMSATETEHFARQHCLSHGLTYVRSECFVRSIEE